MILYYMVSYKKFAKKESKSNNLRGGSPTEIMKKIGKKYKKLKKKGGVKSTQVGGVNKKQGTDFGRVNKILGRSEAFNASILQRLMTSSKPLQRAKRESASKPLQVKEWSRLMVTRGREEGQRRQREDDQETEERRGMTHPGWVAVQKSEEDEEGRYD
jgi:hypothetical protein